MQCFKKKIKRVSAARGRKKKEIYAISLNFKEI